MTSASTPPSIVRALSPLRDFLRTESAGAVLLAASATFALVWANSPWAASYDDLWSTELGVTLGSHELVLDLHHWVNDGLMTFFFLVVGLEVKRELVDGSLSTVRTAITPAIAAVGGMVVPALIYLVIAGSEAAEGWAVPVATDIALALGLLTVVGRSSPASMRPFLLGLAVVDDIGAIVIIAVFYSAGVSGWWLAGGIASVALIVVMRTRTSRVWPFVLAGVALWLCLHEAGVHPTIAGVLLGLLVPAVPRLPREFIDSDDLVDLSSVEAARRTSDLAHASVSQVEWLEHVLHPWSSFVIVPLFALANSGVEITSEAIDNALRSPISWGIVAGLVVGKPLGIVVATRGAARFGIAQPPEASTLRHQAGVGATAGIGFTVALFITELAFEDEAQQELAKISIFAASILAALLATATLLSRSR